MKTKTLFQKKLLAGLMAAIMLVTMAVPTMAFAAENEVAVAALNEITIDQQGALSMKTGEQMNITASYPDNPGDHVEWVSSDEDIATISTHNGQITAHAPGTVTLTANLIQGPKGNNNTGTVCGTTVLGSDTIQLTVTGAPVGTYGAQGIGGNTLLMLNPGAENIIVKETTTDASGKFVNEITVSPESDGTYLFFDIRMGAGMNNFKEQQFIERCMPLIKLYDKEGTLIAQGDTEQLRYQGEDPVEKKIFIGVKESLLGSGKYTLEFGADICGNDTAKTLGAPIQFIFKK